jgi:membrane protein required for colicin V production
MNFLDIFFLITIVISVIVGLLKGLVREIVALVFLAVGIYAALTWHEILGKRIFSSIDDPNVASFLAFLIILFGLIIMGSLIGYVLNRFFIFGPLKSVDRILGGLFGVLRGVVISAAVLLGLMLFQINEKWVTDSSLAPYAMTPLKWVASMLPESLSKRIK